jgi:hypothetical protein
MTSSYSPEESENQAMDLPSGDQAGQRSCAATLSEMLRGSPFSAGTVTISPRNSKAARAPEGEIVACLTYFAPDAQRGLTSGRSYGDGEEAAEA